ncbi:MAG: phosphate acyltransferase PlsX [Firmicutes bacterium]|nr:phosphate acyltransferase PlsX [Bacillota bacterium]
MKIAIDAMGGDYAPEEVVKGAILACRELDASVILVGDENLISAILDKQSISGLKLEICHTTEVIGMDEHPAVAVKKKKDSSLVVANRLVKEGKASAVISAGNTGAAMSASLLTLGRIKGINRPAIASPMPTAAGVSVLLDAGANADCDPENLAQFALMGSIYAEKVFGIRNPRVGLLSIGEEETKGNKLTVAAHQLLKNSGLNFIGNIEGRHVHNGECDVIVCDGFVGNIVLKLSEGLAGVLIGQIKTAFTQNPLALAGAFLAKNAFTSIKRKMDYTEYGGAPLLGLNGISMISHGRSNAKAIKNAIKAAIKAVNEDIVTTIASAQTSPEAAD